MTPNNILAMLSILRKSLFPIYTLLRYISEKVTKRKNNKLKDILMEAINSTHVNTYGEE